MNLSVVCRSGDLFEGEVSEVIVPAYHGEMGILPGHTPLLSVLIPGEVRYTAADGSKGSFETSRGFVTVDNDDVMVIVETGARK